VRLPASRAAPSRAGGFRVRTNSDGKPVSTRLLGEQHVLEDLGRIPTLADWLRAIRGEKWMFARSATPADRVTDEPV
jgi:hypothetical protein